MQRRFRNVSIPSSNNAKKRDDHISESGPEFCIDAGTSGNVARFINHSCEPNLYVQCVLSSHHDARLARVVLFAADNIFPMKVKLLCCTSRVPPTPFFLCLQSIMKVVNSDNSFFDLLGH